MLDHELRALLAVEFTVCRCEVLDYAVILAIDDGWAVETVRVYDGAHGFNEMHRYRRIGKKTPAEIFHHGTLGEGMRAAIALVRDDYQGLIAAWLAT